MKKILSKFLFVVMVKVALVIAEVIIQVFGVQPQSNMA